MSARWISRLGDRRGVSTTDAFKAAMHGDPKFEHERGSFMKKQSYIILVITAR
jgi:hypothetical protein